jgi:AraC family transcriptional regulator
MKTRILSARERAYREETLHDYLDSVEQAVQLMQAQFADALSIDRLADAVHLSRFHFTRVFTQVTGVSPARFLAALRIQEAKRRLLTTDRCVTEICFDVGYSSLGTFTRIFTDFVGYCPVRFRQLACGLTNLMLEDWFGELRHSVEPLAANAITGTLLCDGELSLAVVATFPHPIPRSKPLDCDCITRSKGFALTRRDSSDIWIFSAGLSKGSTLGDALLFNRDRMWVGTMACPDFEGREFELLLRRPRLIDPPVLVAFPLLIAERILFK